MLKHIIAGVEWTVEDTSKGLTYTYAINGITGVAYWENRSIFSYVVVVDDETEPRFQYDNESYREWNLVHKWTLLENVLTAMYDVEDNLTEESYDDFYDTDERYDDYDTFESDRDSDLMNEW